MMKKMLGSFLNLVFIIFFSAFFLCRIDACLAQTAEKKSERVEYKGDEEGADPFATEEQAVEPEKPMVVEKKPLPPLTIQGMVWGGGVPQAIVNNKVVRVGDVIDSVRVTEINREGIWFSYDGQNYNLTAPGLYHSRSAINAFNSEGGNNEEQN